jgi:hypothetical protein
MKRLTLIFLTWCAMCCTQSAFSASPVQRGLSPTDWSGEWELVGLTPHDGGLYQETAAEIAARWDRPPYNNDTRQASFIKPLRQAMGQGGRPPSFFLCTVGYPMLMLESPATLEVLVTPHQTTLVFSTREVRNIYTDGRPHTPQDEIWPTYWGDSIGHWEGQTLVVDTIAVTTPLPAVQRLIPEAGAAVATAGVGGAPPMIAAVFSRQARYTERIRLLKPDLMELEITVHDPMALSDDWKMTRQFRKVVGVNRMVFQDCEGDTRHEIVNGETRLKLSDQEPR